MRPYFEICNRERVVPAFITPCRVVIFSCFLVASCASFGQESEFQLAMPLDPIQSIISEFQTHDIVALTIGGSEEEHDFRLSLLRSREFQLIVDDIVVEFGASRYQDLMDRFVRGEEIAYDDLKNSWQQTTQPHHVSDPPIYEEFFRAVREINLSLPEDDQLRVILAEPPIDRSLIEDYEDLAPWLAGRLEFEAGLIEREVSEKGRKALLMSGGLHFANDTELIRSINAHGGPPFKIWTAYKDLADLQPSVRSWPRPSLALVKETVLGAPDIRGFYQSFLFPPGPFEEQYDAVLYFGPPSSFTEAKIAPELCSDEEYLDMRLPRLEMAASAGATDWLEEFVSYCEQVLAR